MQLSAARRRSAKRTTRRRLRRARCPASATAAGTPPCGAGATARRARSPRRPTAARAARRRARWRGGCRGRRRRGRPGRPSVNIRNMCALHSPMPLTATSSAMTSSSESCSRRSSSSSPATHVLGQRAQEGRLRAREADGDAQLVGLVGQDLLRAWAAGRRSARAGARRSRAPRAPRAAGRRSRARARRRARRAAVAARATPALVEQPREHRVGGAQVLPGVYAWPSTAPGTPVFVEYFGWIFISGRMWWTACDDGDRRLGEAGGDQLELAVEGRDVAARPHAVERRLEQRRRRRSRPSRSRSPTPSAGRARS